MKTLHTPEPWFCDGDAIYNNVDCAGDPIAHVLSMQFDDAGNACDARRIVAAINACEGISTELLEGASLLARHVKGRERLSAYTARVEAQRDQLLAALESIIELHDSARRGSDVAATISNARAAIAAVKGDSSDNTL